MNAKRNGSEQMKVLQQWVNSIGVTKRQKAQREVINQYLMLPPTVLKACHVFRNLAWEFDPNDPEPSIDPSQLAELEKACADRLLELIPANRREKIRSRAESTAEKHIRHLGHWKFLARAELKLRSLVSLCVETASHQWSKRHRISEWEAPISTAKQEFQEAVEEWTRIKRQLDD